MRPYFDVLGALTAAKVRYVVVGGAAEPMPLGDIEVLVASRAHLIRMKELACAQDIADIEALREEPDA